MPSRWVVALSVVFLSFCTEQNRIVVHSAAIDDHTNPDVGEDIELLHVPTDGYTAQKPGFFAIHDMNEWLFVWKDPRPDAKPPPPPREIDFAKEMLFVATAATDDAQGMQISKIVDTTSGRQVYVTEQLGGPGCPAKADHIRPMDIVVIPTTAFDIHVHYDRVHAHDCGPAPEAIALCRPPGAGLPGHAKIIAAPGQTVDCDASQSKPHTGSLVDRGWQLAEAPPGSATKLTVGTQGLGVTFLVDAWGTYRLNLEVRDEARTGSAIAVIEAPPPETGVPIELHWTGFDRNDDASMFPRVELHVAELGNPGNDCGPATAKPWCEVHVNGTLQQAVLRPENATKQYRTYVSYQDFRLKGGPVACVRTFPKGKPSVAVCDETVRTANAVWELGAIDDATSTFYDWRKGKPVPIVTVATVDAGAPVTPTVKDAGVAVVEAGVMGGGVERKNPFAVEKPVIDAGAGSPGVERKNPF
jgi:hypothetical protein